MLVNFGEYLLPRVYSAAEENMEQADLLLVIGTSLRICYDFPSVVAKKGGQVCICNLQKTEYDSACS